MKYYINHTQGKCIYISKYQTNHTLDKMYTL